jgi:hypothetical protein
MVLGDLSRTRKLAGNPSTSNVSDADITAGLTAGTATVIRLTGKSDWEIDINHPDKPSADEAAEYLASGYIRDRFDDQSDISSEHWTRGNSICRQIADSLSNSATGGTGIATRKYRSYPLNSNATIYRSMLSQGQELVGTANFDSTNQ